MGIKTYQVLYDDSAAGNGEWFQLDTRYEDTSERVIQVELTTTDTIKIEATAKDVKGGDKSFLDDLEANEIVTLTTISADGSYTIVGPWAFIRAVKTGTTANAKVTGVI
jgi:hypothetical protein